MDYLLFLQNLRQALGGFLDGFFLTLSRLAESPVPYLLIAWIYWCENKHVGQIMALNTGLSCSASQVVKGFARIERPWVRDQRIVPVEGAIPSATGYSFPSGHTIRAGAAYGSFGLELFRKKAKPAGVWCLIVFILIAFSRNWLGVHTAGDVIAGILLITLVHFFLSFALRWADRGHFRDLFLCGSACIIIFLPMLWLGCLSNCGAGFGFFIGWLCERRFVRFSLPETQIKKAWRAVPGFLVILWIVTAFQSCLTTIMAGKYAVFFANFMLAFFIMVIYPGMFTWAKAKKWILIFLSALVMLLPIGVHLAKTAFAGSAEKKIAVIGHRGFAAAAPENTLPAFEKAMALGVDFVELDVQLSKDRQIVVCHDDNLLRTTGKDEGISSLTLSELKELDAGSWFSPEYTGTQIPSLDEVLDLVKSSDIKIYLELKDIGEDTQFPLDVLQLTQEKQMENRCIFASFQYEYLKEIKAQDPEAKVLLNTTISEKTLPDDYPADYYGIKNSSFSAELAESIHHHGFTVYVWTVDDPIQMEEAVTAGADGICSNCPDQVQAFLKSR